MMVSSSPGRSKHMHRLMTIPELIREIADQLDAEHDKYHFALTCRTMSANCLSSLWYSASSNKLFRLVPHDLVLEDADVGMMSFRPLTAYERVRFEQYASYIHILWLDGHRHALQIINLIKQCCHYATGSPVAALKLFPALRTLHLAISRASCILPCIPLLTCCVDLRRLSILYLEDVLDPSPTIIAASTKLLDTVQGTGHIQAFYFGLGSHSATTAGQLQLGRPFANLLERLRGLQTLYLDLDLDFDLFLEAHTDMLPSIGALPYLQNLRLSHFTCKHPSLFAGFSSLRSLDLMDTADELPHSGMLFLLSSISSHQLQKVELACDCDRLGETIEILVEKFSDSLLKLVLDVVGPELEGSASRLALARLAECCALRSVESTVCRGLINQLEDHDILSLVRSWPKLEVFRLYSESLVDVTQISPRSLVAFAEHCPFLHTLHLPIMFQSYTSTRPQRVSNSPLKELRIDFLWTCPDTTFMAKLIQETFPRLETVYCNVWLDGDDNDLVLQLPGIRSELTLVGWFERYPGRPLPPPGESAHESNIEEKERRFFPRWKEPADI
ncbi:hypothetical protein CALVIDRAFT_217997 [Calocera viscosa TUFC12733]|uniref:F-box domain-containing protein n=1 Tax=Calocera viscosa (strain TUFC12733) TaxID=1330018 RepID=A0A167RI94_CALVF|nr:hypothetical protein CALVIDRAFT_217997 [Calocera viscosa TUFC12733]